MSIKKITCAEAESIVGYNFQYFKHELLWTDYEDTHFIVNLLRRKTNILEIGTHLGYTTENIARVCTGSILTIDIVRDMEISTKFQNNEILTRAESGSKITSTNVRRKLISSDDFFKSNTEKFDGVLIDGDHSYEQVKKDSINAITATKAGGIVVWHDVYNEYGTDVKTKAQPKNMGVVQFLKELDLEVFKIENSWVGFCII